MRRTINVDCVHPSAVKESPSSQSKSWPLYLTVSAIASAIYLGCIVSPPKGEYAKLQ